MFVTDPDMLFIRETSLDLSTKFNDLATLEITSPNKKYRLLNHGELSDKSFLSKFNEIGKGHGVQVARYGHVFWFEMQEEKVQFCIEKNSNLVIDEESASFKQGRKIMKFPIYGARQIGDLEIGEYGKYNFTEKALGI